MSALDQEKRTTVFVVHPDDAARAALVEQLRADDEIAVVDDRPTAAVDDVLLLMPDVLAVAAVSRHNTAIMTFGLVLSVVMMGVAASLIARIIDTHRWIAVLGIIIILAAAARMMWEDLHIWFPSVFPAIPDLGGQFPPH